MRKSIEKIAVVVVAAILCVWVLYVFMYLSGSEGSGRAKGVSELPYCASLLDGLSINGELRYRYRVNVRADECLVAGKTTSKAIDTLREKYPTWEFLEPSSASAQITSKDWLRKVKELGGDPCDFPPGSAEGDLHIRKELRTNYGWEQIELNFRRTDCVFSAYLIEHRGNR